MTRPPSEAVDLTHLIPHLQKHFSDVRNANRLLPRGLINRNEKRPWS